jgi:hypothetical protein
VSSAPDRAPIHAKTSRQGSAEDEVSAYWSGCTKLRLIGGKVRPVRGTADGRRLGEDRLPQRPKNLGLDSWLRLGSQAKELHGHLDDNDVFSTEAVTLR